MKNRFLLLLVLAIASLTSCEKDHDCPTPIVPAVCKSTAFNHHYGGDEICIDELPAREIRWAKISSNPNVMQWDELSISIDADNDSTTYELHDIYVARNGMLEAIKSIWYENLAAGNPRVVYLKAATYTLQTWNDGKLVYHQKDIIEALPSRQ